MLTAKFFRWDPTRILGTRDIGVHEIGAEPL